MYCCRFFKVMIKNLKTGVCIFFICFSLVACSYQQSFSPTNRYYIWQTDDKLSEIAKLYNVSLDDIRLINQIYDERDIATGKKIYLPDFSITYANRQDNADSNILKTNSPNQINIWPVSGRITSGFGVRSGRMHHGVDIVAKYKTPIISAADGVVKQSGWIKGYGKTVIVDHGQRISTLYAHNSENLVVKGQKVKTGEVLALVGRTGNATANLLHFEVRINGSPVDPVKYFANFVSKEQLFADK